MKTKLVQSGNQAKKPEENQKQTTCETQSMQQKKGGVLQ